MSEFDDERLTPADELPWPRLIALLPRLRACAGCERGDADVRETESALRGALHAEFMQPFNWPAWMKAEGTHLWNQPDALQAASLDQLRRLFIALIRGDRFDEGALAAAMRAGTLARMVERAEHLSRAPDA
ncbi:DUF6508 domain-containing protein [Haliangium ochraceum]|nr:DUF6508 domain-containing protein [Haliangium ochraceum]